MSTVAIPFIDFSNENSTMRAYVADTITDASISSFFTAVVGVTIGNAQKSVLEQSTDKNAGTLGPSANPFAQRESKWLVRGTDNVTGKRVTFTIPCPNLGLLVPGTDFLNTATGSAGETLVVSIEANIKSDVGNAMTVNNIQFVGRNT